ncbi:hypothetical protein F7725_027785 [Dissostichus mawsoni]|uniref:Adhesion G-protein coupled receptor D2 n=1 Tax=Dissostichus mawsoni TaxID=36200 RepID=A0A7J5XF62_DISMA|nr:hypothetical protein F7725_027785 [Dissostichus mawsoni]
METRNLIFDEYYEYVPDRLEWKDAKELCNQRSGALATVSSSVEIQELTSFLSSLNISHPVWIARKVKTHPTSSSETLILEFSGRSDMKHARLLHKFPSMDSVTVCTRLCFDPNSFGISTIFSYSIPSYINEFQLRANLIQGKPVQLALLVHGIHGPYQEAFKHDDSWHSVCVSWSQIGGHWTIFIDGRADSSGDGLNSDKIGPDGLFILGQEQDTFGGSFKKDESFSGSITELHIWDRVLSSSEIDTMEKQCSPISSGLVFKWNEAAMEKATSLTKLWGDVPCKIPDGHSLQNQTFNVELFQSMELDEDCDVFNPSSMSSGRAKCKAPNSAVCHHKKEVLAVISVPKTPFFSRLNKDLLIKPVSGNSSWDRDLALLQQLTQAVLQEVEEGGSHLLTSSDVLYLTQMIEKDLTALAGSHSAGSDAAEVMVSIATNYLKVASSMLEPGMATQWMGITEDGVSVGPFTIVQSIDSLTETLAKSLSAEKRGFTLSTKNIDVCLTWQKLTEESLSQVFKPSAVSSHTAGSSSQDEMLIPDTELHRIHALGYEEVMFIHTHYRHLSEIVSETQEPSQSHQEKNSPRPPGSVASVISATVRDASKGQTIPVAVKYTLSSSHVVRDGCMVTFAGSGVTSCLCNHTTNFAVLMNYLESKWSPEEELILTKLTFIGAGASLCALLVTLMLFTVLDIPKSDRTSIHKNLFIALICAQVILLCSGSAIHNKLDAGGGTAALEQGGRGQPKRGATHEVLLSHRLGLPVLIVTITLASASGKYSADGYCWLSVQNGVIWGFAGPVIFIIMVNILVLTRVVVITISTAKRRAAVKAILVLLPILGLTWLCGVLVPFSIVMAYIFILLNSLQVRSTVNRINERRKALNFSNCASSRPSSSVTSSRPVSFPLGTTPSQEEEATPTHTSSNTPSPGRRKTGPELSIPCVPERLESQTSKGHYVHKKEPGSSEGYALPAGCSLHVPMELEFTASCFPRSPATQKSYGLVHVD